MTKHTMGIGHSCWTLLIGLMSWTATFRPDLDWAFYRRVRMGRWAEHE